MLGALNRFFLMCEKMSAFDGLLRVVGTIFDSRVMLRLCRRGETDYYFVVIIDEAVGMIDVIIGDREFDERTKIQLLFPIFVSLSV